MDMKRLLTSAAMFLCSLLTFAQFSGSGSGTENDPYLIFNENQLAQVSNFLNQEGVVFKLMKDLDLTDWIAENNPKQGWIPIGVESSPFKGIFNGNNHKVKGLSIKRSTEDNVGFFGYTLDATIQDLTLEGAYVIGKDNVGGFAGQLNSSTLSNVSLVLSNTDGVSGDDNIGGFFGKAAASTFTNCHVTVSGKKGVSGSSSVGGFGGYSSNTTINEFSSSTAVNAIDYGGGLMGVMDDGICQNGVFEGNIIVSNGSGGGLTAKANGYNVSDVTITGNLSCVGSGCQAGGMIAISMGVGKLLNCRSFGDLSAQNTGGEDGALGGIIGFIKGGSSVTLESCFSKGKLTNTGDYTGGVIGESEGACIAGMESCSHFGDIKGLNYVGGLIGAIVSVDVQPHLCTYTVYSSISNSQPRGSLLQTTHEKIINGSKMTIPINNCTSIGNLAGNDWVGGLIGSDLSSYGYSPNAITTSCISNDYYKYLFKDDVYTGTSTYYHGTLGYTHSYSRNSVSSSLTNNYYSGTIQGNNYVGGLVGIKGGGELKNNYSYATVYGSKDVGGIVGSTTAQTASDSYSVTTIKSNVANCQIISATNSNLGRIYGSIAGDDYTVIGASGSAEGNRALAQTRLILQGVVQEEDDNLQQGTSIGPSALRLKANYVSWGWDFDNNWNILETESYPYKKYQAAPPVIESDLVSQKMGISGKSLNGGTVYLYYKDQDAVSTTCSGHNWTFSTNPLQSGAQVKVYADVEGMTPSYFATTFVGYPGKGTEDDPYRIYTAEDLQGASNRGYYKLMNDIDLTSWINENSPTEGWPAIGRNSGEVTYIDGDNHKVTGLWIDTEENFNGLFSNFSAGQIKNLIVEVAAGKKVKGGDYTGILIGRNANGRIVNCTVKGDVEGTNHTGGVAGLLVASEVCDITFDGTIGCSADNAYIGGLAGQTEDCDISACNITSVITLSGTSGKAGGLVGESKEGTIKSSKTQATLTATGENYFVGGLVGYSETPITLCSSSGTVTASGETTYSGGLVGYALSPVDNSYSTANTTGTEFSAGLVGYTFSTIDKCYASGDVNGYMYGAGVVGELDGPNACLTNCVALNNILSLTAQSSWGCRVIGGFKNGAPDPDESNLALSTMQVSLNGVAEIKTDDMVEGKAMAPEVLKTKKTYEQLGWDFSNTWEIAEGTSYPILQTNGSSSTNPEPDPGPNPEPVPTDDDVLSVAEITVGSGSTANFAINLINKATDLTAYQFDLILPTGFTLATNDKGKYQVSKGDRYEDSSQTLNVSKVESSTNTYRIVCFSLSNDMINGTSGAILHAVLSVDKNIVDGTFEGKISNIVFTKTDGKQLKLNDAKFNIVIGNKIMGDANGDGEINVADIVEIVNYILGKPSAKFVMAAADLNGDGEVNVTDIVKVVSIIMSTYNVRHRSPMAESTDNDKLTLVENENHVLSLCLNNESGYVASQFDIHLSAGQTLEGIMLNSGRSKNHVLTYTKTDNDTYRVIVYSLGNQAYAGNSGELLGIQVSGTGNVDIDNILFITTGQNEKRFAPLHSYSTGINAINKNETIDVYNINGSLIRKQVKTTTDLEKGVYIINGKKQIVK